jgi:phosphopantetheinyl transferase
LFCVGLGNSPGIAVALAHPVEFPIGIDIKTVSADKADGLIGEMSISDAERARLDDANESLEIACGVHWTALEALAKMLKVGLSVPLNILSLGNIRAVDSGNGAYRRHLAGTSCRLPCTHR